MTTRQTRRRSGWQRAGKPTASAQVTRGYQWQRTRRRILRRDDWECQIRGPRCLGDASEVDKIVPISLGGSDTDDENLRAVCVPCHRSKTAREAAAASAAARAQRIGKRRTRTHPSDALLGGA
ncbi:HNH endonuclease [Mycobacterium paraintracellulare]|uniref:HNH endonuclease n=1 Tax=Mycobacterium paraintracellulare TaxID=1138383 RepID=UPI001916614E|nr:HNH endonuclease signature motif containing protein [Mycobacterium paraintracellulare]